MTDLWSCIGADIARATQAAFSMESRRAVGGGCINQAWVVEGGGRRWFVKVNQARAASMFTAEARGLREMAASFTVRVPRVLCHGTAGDDAYLVLEHLTLRSGGPTAGRQLGRQLAAMHRCTGAAFGWCMDNTIGTTPQLNPPTADWVDFWRHQRLGHQLELAAASGYDKALAGGRRLLELLPRFFDGYTPAPSLLHGDLWSGNWGEDRHGRPVVFDPAVYYGDREADIAMTELFGGFGSEFYAAYRDESPLDPGYPARRRLYNLYHILSHLNLSGGGYLSKAQQLIQGLLAELG